jgi:hypothetical protein
MSRPDAGRLGERWIGTVSHIAVYETVYIREDNQDADRVSRRQTVLKAGNTSFRRE